MKQARARRSVLYVPAANAKAMAKAGSLDCDAIIYDLEDAVAPTAKSDARDALKAHFADQPTCAKERIIRINAMATTWGKDDLAAAIACRPDAVLLPKVEHAEQLLFVRRALDAGGADGIRLWAMVETPLGIVNIREITALGEPAGLECLVAGRTTLPRKAAFHFRRAAPP